VFANRSFSRDEFILEFKGRIHSRDEYCRALCPGNCHFLQIGQGTLLGPSGSLGDYVNHCCCPNSGVKLIQGRAQLFATREIRPGEEIWFDYSTTMAEDHWEMDCTCGAPGCRGRIRDFRHLPKAFRIRYANMGIVPAFVLDLAPLSADPRKAVLGVPIPEQSRPNDFRSGGGKSGQ